MTLTPTGEMAIAPGKGSVPSGPSTTIPNDAIIDLSGDDVNITPAPTPTETSKPAETPTETPVETPEAPLDENPFDVIDKLSSKLGDKVKPVETPKPEAKPEAKPDPAAPAPIPAGPRPKTGIAEVDEVLGRLPNSAFAKYKDMLPKWHEAYKKAQEAPKYLAAHQEAYKLTPEYQQVVGEQTQNSFEYRAFRQAALSIEGGKPFKLLTGYDEKSGEPVFEVIKPDANGKFNPEVALHVREAMAGAQRNLGQSQAALDNFKQNHGRLVQSERQFIDESFKKMFKGIDEAKFTVEEKKLGEQMKLLVPDSFSPEDARRLAHYSAITVLRLSKMVNDYMAQQTAKTATPPKPRPGGNMGADDIIPLDDNEMFAKR